MGVKQGSVAQAQTFCDEFWDSGRWRLLTYATTGIAESSQPSGNEDHGV
jgi:hypothetical protein